MARAESGPPAHRHASDPDSDAPRARRAADLLETYFAHACHVLRHGSGRRRIVNQARRWLARRGVEASQIDKLPLGVLPEVAETKDVLRAAGFGAEEIQASRLLDDPRLPGRLLGAIRDPDGRIVSFWARHPKDRSPNYLIKGPWKEHVAVFGLDVALPAMDDAQGGLVVVEDFLEAVLLHSWGFLPVAAIGGLGFQMTCPRWRRLAELGVSLVTLALTAPSAHDAVLAALKAALAAETSPQVYVVPPGRFLEAGGLLPWVQRHGCEAFRNVVQSERIHASRYLDVTRTEQPVSVPAESASEQPVSHRRPAVYCRLHHCDATQCFCFD